MVLSPELCTELSKFTIAGFHKHELVGQDKKACLSMLFNMMSLQRARNRDTFPGANPVSMDRADLCRLFTTPYWVAPKTDGNRFLLMAVVVRGQKLAVLVDRAMRFFVVPGCLPAVSFNNSLIDGELIYDLDTDGWVYVVFDCIYLAGIRLASHPFSVRLEAAHSWMQDMGDGLRNISVRMKAFTRVGDGAPQGKCGLASDGLIFVAEDQPYLCHRNDTLLKWKANQQHSVDFKCGRGKLFVGSKGKMVEKAAIHPEDAHMTSEGAIVECLLQEGEWRVAKVRTDKSIPNDLFVMTKTLQNIEENIQYEELHQICLRKAKA